MSTSVVIVTHESEQYITSTLTAVFALADRAGQVIVVDNASTDGTIDAISAFPVHLIEPGANLGFGEGVNRGVKEATGDIVVLLGHDTTPTEGWLQALTDPLSDRAIGAAMATIEQPEPPGTFNTSGGALTFYGVGWITDVGRSIPPDEPPIVDVAFATGTALAMRRSVWDEIGGFRTSLFMYHEDTDLSWRLRIAGYRIVRAAHSRVVHHYEFGRLDTKMYHLERNRKRLLATNYRRTTRLLLFPAFVIADLGIWIVAIRDGWAKQKSKAANDAWRNRRSYRDERLSVEASRRTGDVAVLRSMTAKVGTIEQVAAPRGSAFVDWLLGGWLTVVRPVIAFFDRRSGFSS
jgi:GT2 family glycosyltransferase